MRSVSTRLALPAAFAVLLSIAAYRASSGTLTPGLQTTTARIAALKRALPPEQGGEFPPMWINGADCVTEPAMQAWAYNEDTYIIRQGKCEVYEAPFLYLIFGEDTALLMDTGANSATRVYLTVKGVIDEWLARNNRESIELIVAHTHGHFDHVQGDNQFINTPLTTQFVPAAFGPAMAFWGFSDYPDDTQTIDLGGRVLDVLGTPGHHPASVTLYDRRTNLLLTADIVYPGHLFVFSQPDWFDFIDSLQRLVDWAATHPVEWVVGCHIETSAVPGMPFSYGTPFHPDEHVLQLPPTILTEILGAAQAMGGTPQCQIFDEFVIHPVYLCGIVWNG